MNPEQTYKEALQRIVGSEADAESLQRIARRALANPYHTAGVICAHDHTHQSVGNANRCSQTKGGSYMRGT